MKYVLVLLSVVLLSSCELFLIPISRYDFVLMDVIDLMAAEMTIENYKNMNEKTVIDLEKTPFYFSDYDGMITFGSRYYRISAEKINPDKKSERKGIDGFINVKNKTMPDDSFWVNCYGHSSKSIWEFYIGDSIKILAKMKMLPYGDGFEFAQYALISVNGWNYENDKKTTEISEVFNNDECRIELSYNPDLSWKAKYKDLQVKSTSEKALKYFPFPESSEDEKKLTFRPAKLPILIIDKPALPEENDYFLLYIISNSDTQLTLRRTEPNRVYNLIFQKIQTQ